MGDVGSAKYGHAWQTVGCVCAPSTLPLKFDLIRTNYQAINFLPKRNYSLCEQFSKCVKMRSQTRQLQLQVTESNRPRWNQPDSWTDGTTVRVMVKLMTGQMDRQKDGLMDRQTARLAVRPTETKDRDLTDGQTDGPTERQSDWLNIKIKAPSDSLTPKIWS